MNKIPLICFGDKAEKMETEYGFITRDSWVKKESKRIGKHTKIVYEDNLVGLLD